MMVAEKKIWYLSGYKNNYNNVKKKNAIVIGFVIDKTLAAIWGTCKKI